MSAALAGAVAAMALSAAPATSALRMIVPRIAGRFRSEAAHEQTGACSGGLVFCMVCSTFPVPWTGPASMDIRSGQPKAPRSSVDTDAGNLHSPPLDRLGPDGAPRGLGGTLFAIWKNVAAARQPAVG